MEYYQVFLPFNMPVNFYKRTFDSLLMEPDKCLNFFTFLKDNFEGHISGCDKT